MIVGGQEVEITEGGNYKLNIMSIFTKAGMIYNFPLNQSGIGINEKILKKAKRQDKLLFVTIGDSKTLYLVKPGEILDLTKKYNSIMNIKGNRIHVFPIKTLRRAK